MVYLIPMFLALALIVVFWLYWLRRTGVRVNFKLWLKRWDRE